MNVRTRFSPSPTGFLHIGGVRTALYCYALAKRHSGSFILRVEDTDQSRYLAEYEEEIYNVLETYGLIPTESDRHGGEHGPYTQSKRLDLYLDYAKQLVERGGAYYCFLTPDEEEELKEKFRNESKPFRSPHRNFSADKVQKRLEAGEKYVIRQRMPSNRAIEFADGLQGSMQFNTDDIDEGVLLKSDGFATYHLAMLVDDHLMEITHVFRGVEWMPSVPKHVLLYETMEWKMPEMFHLSVILDPEGGKLSKRRGNTAANEFVKEGYLPEAVLNFLMMLGWAAPIEREYGEAEREIFSLEEFVNMFDPKDLNKASPVFNREKLEWYSQQYLADMPAGSLAEKLRTWLANTDESIGVDLKASLLNDEGLVNKIELVQTRVKLLSEIPNMLEFFYVQPQPNLEIPQLSKISTELIKPLLDRLADLHQQLGEPASWEHEQWETAMRALADEYQIKHGDMFMLLRVATVGSPYSPPLFESLQILGTDEIMLRLQNAK